jgi:hypothetical protein
MIICYNEITESDNILLQSPLEFKNKTKIFLIHSHHIMSQFTWHGNNGTHKVRVILKWFSNSLLNNSCSRMFYIILLFSLIETAENCIKALY